jgi:hypothetical protein
MILVVAAIDAPADLQQSSTQIAKVAHPRSQ